MSEKDISIADRYKGTLIGSAVGDAAGAPVEFMYPEEVAAKIHVVENMLGGGSFRWKPGQETDDTDNALCLIDSMVELGQYVPENIAQRLVTWFEGRPKDVGNLSRVSLQILSDGASWKESGKLALLAIGNPNSAGNGSLMRTHPVGLYFRGSPDKIDQTAAEISAITHANPDCILGCQIASEFVSLLASGNSRPDSIDALKKLYPESTEAGKKLRLALDGSYATSKFGWVLNTLSIAMTSFIEAPDFKSAVMDSIKAGYDTDTQAAVAGAFAGAYWGREAIPEGWQTKLNPVSAEEFASKAQKLYELNLEMHQ